MLHELDEATAQRGFFYARKCSDELETVGRRHKFSDKFGRRRVRSPGWSAPMDRSLFEKEGYRHLQDTCDMLKPACANAIGPSLIFLNLLESKSKRVAEFRL